MQNYKIIQNTDNFKRPIGTYSYVVYTKNENTGFELSYRACACDHETIEDAKACDEAIEILEAGGFDPTGRLAIKNDLDQLNAIISRYSTGELIDFDYRKKETWPPKGASVLMYSHQDGFAIGEFQIYDLDLHMFIKNRQSTTKLQNFTHEIFEEIKCVTSYFILKE